MNPKDFASLVVSQLNTIPDKFINFTAVRGYNARLMLEKVAALKVLVVAKAVKFARHDETGWEHLLAVDVGIVKKLSQRAIITGTEDNTEIDPLMNLVEQIGGYFRSDDYEPPAGYDLVEIANDPIYDAKHLEENRQFTSVVTVTFRGIVEEVPE